MRAHRTSGRNDNGIKALSLENSGLFACWRLVYYPPNTRLEKHQHSVAQFSVLLSGHAREVTDLGAFDSRPMLMEFKPSGFRHSNEFGPDGALMLSININPGEAGFHESFPSQAWLLHHSISVKSDWAYLARNILRASGVTPDEMELRTIDLLNVLTQSTGEDASGCPPPWLRRARAAVIETNDSIESIAVDAGVHRVHLSRSFRRHFGHTISECRRQVRLGRAVRLLAQTGAAASEASYAAGFSDQSHLTRVMRRETGLTPAALRSRFRI